MSQVKIFFNNAIYLSEWNQFCEDHGIEYDPSLPGLNVFRAGDVNVVFGEPFYSSPSRKKEINLVHECPRKFASTAKISSSHRGRLEAVAEVAKKITKRWSSMVSADPELVELVR